ncbi:MAG: 4'-phosphopantetheinyl transferase family protein [Lachnospiraceae bacterium]
MQKAIVYFAETGDVKKFRGTGQKQDPAVFIAYVFQTYYQIEYEGEPKVYGEHGKPAFVRHPELCYNISHSGSYTACAVAPFSIGLDIQKHVAVDVQRLAKRLSPEALSAVLSKPDDAAVFFDQWVLHESYLKWTGDGFSRETKELPFADGCHASFAIEPGYSASLYAEEPFESELLNLTDRYFTIKN